MKNKIPVDIRVRSERLTADLSRSGNELIPETDEFLVGGVLKKVKGGLRLQYEEDGGNVVTTIDCFDDAFVSLSRIGETRSYMAFTENKSMDCICDTGFFPIQLRVTTQKLQNTLTRDGGNVDIEYSVEILGSLAEKNRLSLSVSPDISVLRS
ncbi:MAG: DUF1934 domain-containing protein [Clostridiales bacterium]|nr:DUF1934 domain-containing protein [Candidatus Coliplasma equi]